MHFVQRKLGSLAELAGEGWDVVVNCSGLGSQQLLPDRNCYPIRGQIMRVKAPWVNQCVFAHFPDETAYIIPNRYAMHRARHTKAKSKGGLESGKKGQKASAGQAGAAWQACMCSGCVTVQTFKAYHGSWGIRVELSPSPETRHCSVLPFFMFHT